MRDSKRAMRTAYFNVLNGSLSIDSTDVPVADKIRSDIRPPYVKLSTQTAVDGPSGKIQCRTHDTTILLDIVTNYDGNKGGKHHCDLIAEQIFPLILPEDDDNLPDLGTDFRIVRTEVESDFDIEEKNQTSTIVRRLIRLRNTIEQLNYT